jgi:hypothetical protein
MWLALPSLGLDQPDSSVNCSLPTKERSEINNRKLSVEIIVTYFNSRVLAAYNLGGKKANWQNVCTFK